MSNDKALTILDFDTMQRMSMALYKSGYFKDVKSEAQAIVKVMAGNELGIPPFASMAGIHIIQGKPTLGANLIATLVKNDPRYDYKVHRCDNANCQINWFENGQMVGSSTFTIKEAQNIQQWNTKKNKMEPLSSKHNWVNYPSDMLFARAITRGARRYAPGIFGGAPVYTLEELGADVDPDGYIEGEIVLPDPRDPEKEVVVDHTSEIVTPPGDTPEEQIANFEDEVKNGNGAKFAGNVADARAWLDEKIKDGTVVLGIVADALCMTGLYNDRKHVSNWLNSAEGKELRDKGLDPDMRKNVKAKGALMVFDAGVERKEPAEEGADG